MKYTYENLTVDIDVVDRQDLMGDCYFQVLKEHQEFLDDWCGCEKQEDGSYSHEYGELYPNGDNWESSNPDILIAYMSWCLQQDKPMEIEVQSEHPFWVIHDVQHAVYDESGCTVYVDAHIEKQRLIDAFKILAEHGKHPSLEMVQEIEEAFKARFNESLDLYRFCEVRFSEEMFA